jgi:NAD(P)-dependent dehydrogenase (short-subunit alcohol dehydrogenase family)
MNMDGRVAVVTGGASGIGLGLATRFVHEGAQVVLSDLHEEATAAKAAEIGAYGFAANVGVEQDIAALTAAAINRFGRIDLFVSNAGIAIDGGPEVPTAQWDQIWAINVMAHVWAAKYALPGMLDRGEGYLLNVASAAGLLAEFHTAPYTVTKHAAVGLAEWLAITYGDHGVKVSVLCPAGVKTPIIAGIPSLEATAISTDELADITMEAIAAERFLILTHDFVRDLLAVKGADYERYIATMREQRTSYLHADSD